MIPTFSFTDFTFDEKSVKGFRLHTAITAQDKIGR